jgi:adenine-specific DNA methylase
MDPPYYDNVMYAELADFFYVWEKHTLGRIIQGFFEDSLTDKENEAVANVARFTAMGKRKRELADLDYEAKMTSIFAECRRILRDDGVMSVMFTHKRAEAWDTLGMGLLRAGFTVETSWPVNTEAESSLHQVNVNSAASTIMLVCRKRKDDKGSKVFLDDIDAEVRSAAREAVTRYRGYGIDGVDLLLSTYGPALSVISSHWPVYSTDADEDGRSRLLRPQEALDLAREEVVRLQRRRIVGREVQIDDHSDFVLIAWETFKAAEFPFDEGRRLALAVGGLDVDELAQAKIVEKKSGRVRLLSPVERLRRGGDDTSTGVRPEAAHFEYMNDAVDTVLYIAAVDGMGQAKMFMDRLGLTEDQRFLACIQGLVNAIPRIVVRGEWLVPQAGLLDTLVTAYFLDIALPAIPPAQSAQDALFD